MITPDKFTIQYLLSDFGELYESLEDQLRAGDINFHTYNEALEKLYNHFSQAFKLIFSKEDLSFSYLTVVNHFNKEIESGCFNTYDGHGYYLDFNGNQLGSINWNNIYNYPKNTVFIAWYNK